MRDLGTDSRLPTFTALPAAGTVGRLAQVGTRIYLDTGLAWVNIGDASTGLTNPSRIGINAWTGDPVTLQTARTPTLGTLSLMAMFPSAGVANGGTINVEIQVTTAGATLTYGRLGVYSYAAGVLTLIGTSADLTTASAPTVTTTGMKSIPITLSAAINAGDTVYVGCLFTGTTSPALAGAAISYQIGRGTPVRSATLAAQSALPSSVTLSGTATSSSLLYFGF